MGDRQVISDQTVKDATTEYLSHKGERPYRVMRGGQQLWESHADAMRAALSVALSAEIAELRREIERNRVTVYTSRM